MDKITLILKEELKKERDNYLTESFKSLSEISDRDLLVQKLGETTIKLIEDGYTPEEITLVVEQDGGIFGALKDKEGKFNLWNTIMGGGKSMFFEQMIRILFVDILGMSEKWGQSAAILLSDYNPLHILRLFKNQQYCTQEVTELAPAIIEVIINNSPIWGESQETMTVSGVGKVGVRNVAIEALRESNLDDIIARKICEYIWK